MRSLDLAWGRASILKEWRWWVIKIKEAANETLAANVVGIYLFGSVVRGEAIASSDIDILIVARNLPKSMIKRSELKEEILEKAGLPTIHPFEIHLVDVDEAETYFRHIHGEFIKL